jgi:hypothetical protein
MKNNVIFGIALLLGFVSAHAELTYMDSIKSSIDANGFYLDRWNSKKRDVDSDIIHTNAMPLYLSGVNLSFRCLGKRSALAEKIIQYNAWYNQHHMLHAIDKKGEFVRYNYGTRELSRKALVAEIVEPVIFLAADSGFGILGNAMGETEAGKTVAQAIPPFWKKNGITVASAFVARTAGTVAKGESLSENAQAFGKSAFMHIGSNALGEYVINPGIDKLMGSEDRIEKECVKFAANGIGLVGVYVGLHVSLKMLGHLNEIRNLDFIL